MTQPTEPRGPQSYVRLHHDKTFDLRRAEDVPEGTPTYGEYDVESPQGTEKRVRVLMNTPGGYTDIDISPDFSPDNMTEVLHLAQTLTERHASVEHVTAVSGTDPDLVHTLAVLLKAEVIEHAEESPPVPEVSL